MKAHSMEYFLKLHGDEETIKFIKTNNPNLDGNLDYDIDPFIFSAYYDGSIELIKLCINRTTNINYQSAFGATILHKMEDLIAKHIYEYNIFRKQHFKAYTVTKLLLKAGANPNIKDIHGQTLLIRIVGTMCIWRETPYFEFLYKIYKLLIKYGATFNIHNYKDILMGIRGKYIFTKLVKSMPKIIVNKNNVNKHIIIC